MAPLKLLFPLQCQVAGFTQRLTQRQLGLFTQLYLLIELSYQLVTTFYLHRQGVPFVGEGVFRLPQAVAIKHQYQQGQQQRAGE